MKNFKAKELLSTGRCKDAWSWKAVECDCCNQKKERCLMICYGYSSDILFICLDCLQYTDTQERIEQLESYLYPEAKEFENNEKHL